MNRPTLAEVIDRHAPALLAQEGVAGVWEGREPGGVPCLVVAVIRDDPAIRASLPEALEGYRIQVQVTGEIRPLGGQ